jgi:solute carrier family 35 protein C2
MTSADDKTPSDSAISRWLAGQDGTPSHPPRSPGNEFPLRTLPSLPSDSSLSDADSEDGIPVTRPHDIATAIHPRLPSIMDAEQAAQNHARRRSSSLAGASVPTSKKDPQKHRRQRSDHIAEEGEEESSASDTDSRSDSTDLELDDMSADGLEDDEETGLTKRDRRRRRRRKRKNTLLDQRIVPTTDTYTKEEKKLADQTLMRSMLINGVLIALWYLFSISISVYNKWMFKEAKGDGEAQNIFPFPLFTTCLHMLVQFTLASLVMFMIPSLRPRHDSLNPHASGTRVEPVDPKKPLMTKWFYFSRIGPCGAATGMDIGLGNTSLKFISLTFFSMSRDQLLLDDC